MFIGLDVGSRSLGIATSDSLNMLAHGKENYKFDELNFVDAIEHLTSNYDVPDAYIVGWPKRLDNNPSSTTEMVQEFIDLLKDKTNIKIIKMDERFTTKIAKNQAIATGQKYKNMKGKKDMIAATLILQGYLDQI